jgi:quaternary ammonium compound-resistance protein SugE
MRSIPAGTAYTGWTAIGAVVLGILFLKEFAKPVRLVGIALIVAGVVALRFAEAA